MPAATRGWRTRGRRQERLLRRLRAPAVKFGIGRYLYRDGVPRFVHERVRHPSLAAEPTQHAHPSSHALPQAEPAPSTSRPAGDGPGAPQSGKALFAWIKKQDEKYGFGLLKTVSDWAKRQDFPARMVQWNAEQVQKALIEAQAAIQVTRTTQNEPTPLPSTKGNERNRSKGRDRRAGRECEPRCCYRDAAGIGSQTGTGTFSISVQQEPLS